VKIKNKRNLNNPKIVVFELLAEITGFAGCDTVQLLA
jgi:hypothetical protein